MPEEVVEVGAPAEEAWIRGTSFACAESLRAICGVAGFTPVIALDSNRCPATPAMVAAGHGTALVPSPALAAPPPDVTVRPLRPLPPPRRLWAATQGRSGAAVTHLVDCLVATATALPRLALTDPGSPRRSP
ncbi:LysR substrate-binding domain-containing protein [Streptomyces sp. Act143]|uniref:LysR substrate-binding domain-containing protein n=1 Tax=Streptomyces sp. Act143 TaxID=2200760 RepID=UPI0015E7F86F|nr:LysR substrate-binding domain-containing protein [Streptomyces sp. Act143]